MAEESEKTLNSKTVKSVLSDAGIELRERLRDLTTLNKNERKLRKEKREREALKKPLKTQIHPWSIISYVLILVVTVSVNDFLRNHFMMIVFWIVALAPILDIVGFFFLYRNVDVAIKAPEKNIERNTVGYIRLLLNNTSYMVSYNVNVKLKAENTFYRDDSGVVISLPCGAKGVYDKFIPINYSMNGIYKYTITEMTLGDMMGFISLSKKVNQSAEINVFPESENEVKLDMTDISRGMTESEETLKKGHDFSDVSDVREYIPGDKLMSIHWKLSAKRDILMVKDRVSMSDQQMVILVEMAGSDEEVDEVISLAYGVINKLVREQTYVRIMWWSEANFAFEERQIMNRENLKDAFTDMYYEKTYPDGEKTKGYMRSIKPELKAYVNICMRDGEPDAVVVEQD